MALLGGGVLKMSEFLTTLREAKCAYCDMVCFLGTSLHPSLRQLVQKNGIKIRFFYRRKELIIFEEYYHDGSDTEFAALPNVFLFGSTLCHKRFGAKFAEISEPINSLTHEGVDFSCDAEHRQSPRCFSEGAK